MKNIKEGAWGKKEPGYEYVIWDASKEGIAPILGIRSTYDEALSLQLRLMKTNKYENISFDRVPKGKFVKGDDFWGPFDADWNLIEEGVSYRGYAYYKYKNCNVRETPTCFVAIDEHGNTLGDSKTKAGAESIIDDYLSKKSVKEASSAEKRAYKDGGKELADYVQGKAIARIKDPEARDAAVALAKAGNSKVDRFVGDRKVDQAERSFEKKADKMQKAGIKEAKEDKKTEYIELPHEVYEKPEDLIRVNNELDAKAKAGKLVGIRKEKKMLQLAEPEINGIWTIFLNDEGFIEKIVLF